jgi:hypothetical protein
VIGQNNNKKETERKLNKRVSSYPVILLCHPLPRRAARSVMLFFAAVYLPLSFFHQKASSCIISFTIIRFFFFLIDIPVDVETRYASISHQKAENKQTRKRKQLAL